jgi:hypothetical protein
MLVYLIYQLHYYNMPALQQHDALPPQYLSGYVDGEGCFTVSFSRRPSLKIGWETRPSFSVSQNEDSAQVLYAMKEYFQAGHLRRDYSDKTLKYEVRNLQDLLTKIIPHFEMYSLRSRKHEDFLLFRDVCIRVHRGEHRTSCGLANIVEHAYQMNPSGIRRRRKEEVLKSIVEDEDIVHTTGNSGIM